MLEDGFVLGERILRALVGKSGAIDVGKLLDSQRLPASEIFDNIVGAGEDSVLIVLCHRGDVLLSGL